MEKTTSINLGGSAFIIEEGAYQNLKNYLESVRRNISSEADRDEVMIDIEMSIAEKLKEKSSLNKQVITASDIEELIEVMGHPEDFYENNEEGSSKEKEQSDMIKRKLYRNSDDMIIGGVCSGIASYFNIEPVLIRLVAFLLIFCNGFGIFAYIILWIIIPVAETKSQKLEMRGSPLTVAAIEQSFKEIEGKKENHSVLNNIFKQIGNIIKRLFVIFIKICLFFINFSIIALSIFTIIGMAIFVGVTIMYANSGYTINDIPISEIVKSIPFYFLLISSFFAITIPAFLLLITDIAIAFHKKIASFAVVIVLIVIWMLSSIATVTMAIRYAPDLKLMISDTQYRQTVEIPSIENFNSISANGKNLIISVKLGDKFSVIANGMPSDLNQISYKVDENGILNINIVKKEANQKCLFCDQKIARIAITTPNIENIKINDSDLNIEKMVSDKISIEASGSDNISIDGNIKDLDFKATSTYANLSGKFDKLAIEANKTNLTYDVDAENADIKLYKSTETNTSGSIGQTNIEMSDNSRLNGLESDMNDVTITLKNDSWAIIKALNNLSTDIDENSGLFYIGDAKQNVITNSPFATFTKISKVSLSEYRKNQSKDSYFHYLENNYKLDIDNADSELFQEKRELLREKF
ncbi:MAG: PspC domain-containing protein [Candidatus Pacebacteria bacterium]|nr:PspC domain-containing protein [Candidatus Paceibacterota bacterium]